MQPLAADDVAAALADVAVGAPLNATVELAGPEAMSIAEFVGRFMAASGDKRTVIADPQALYTGAVMGEPRDRTGSESASRPDAVRGLVRPRRHGQRRSGPLRARARRVAVVTGEECEVDPATGKREC